MRKLLLLGIVILSMPAQSRAGCNLLPRLVCAEYANSELVVVARLMRTEHVVPAHQRDGYIYTMKTGRTLRGEIGDAFEIYEENSTGRASFVWIKGEEYLLFLKSDGRGTWWLYGCGNSAPLKEAGFALRAIEAMKTRRGGLIHGLVHSNYASDSVAGITVQIHGRDRDYSVITDKNGEFRLHVPAGTYDVHPSHKGWSFSRSIDGFEDPSALRMEDGGCAQIVFDTVEDR